MSTNKSKFKKSKFKIGAIWLCISVLTVAVAHRQSFRELAQPLIEASCIDCHDGSGDNGLDFNKINHDLTDPDQFRTWERIYDRVEAGEMPPESESRPDPKHASAALSSIRKSLTAENKRFQSANGRVILRRLTRTEYEHTLNDLLYVKSDVSGIIPAENSSSGFDTVYSSQGFSPLHIKSFLEAADVALDSAIQLSPEPDPDAQRGRLQPRLGQRAGLVRPRY